MVHSRGILLNTLLLIRIRMNFAANSQVLEPLDMHTKPQHTATVEFFFPVAQHQCQKYISNKFFPLYFSTSVSVLHFPPPHSNIFLNPFFFPVLLSFSPPHLASPFLVSHPLHSPSQRIPFTCLHLLTVSPLPRLCICPLTVRLSFHTSVYTPCSVVPFASLPAPRMCAALHGQRAPRPIKSQSPGNTGKLPDTYSGRWSGRSTDNSFKERKWGRKIQNLMGD